MVVINVLQAFPDSDFWQEPGEPCWSDLQRSALQPPQDGHRAMLKRIWSPRTGPEAAATAAYRRMPKGHPAKWGKVMQSATSLKFQRCKGSCTMIRAAGSPCFFMCRTSAHLRNLILTRPLHLCGLGVGYWAQRVSAWAKKKEKRRKAGGSTWVNLWGHPRHLVQTAGVANSDVLNWPNCKESIKVDVWYGCYHISNRSWSL